VIFWAHYRVTGVSQPLERAFAALAFFTEARGLDRSLEIAADLNNIARTTEIRDAFELRPTANARAYAEYVFSLALRCTEADEAPEIEQAALRSASACILILPTCLVWLLGFAFSSLSSGAVAGELLALSLCSLRVAVMPTDTITHVHGEMVRWSFVSHAGSLRMRICCM
jgi:hypothetical protein